VRRVLSPVAAVIAAVILIGCSVGEAQDRSPDASAAGHATAGSPRSPTARPTPRSTPTATPAPAPTSLPGSALTGILGGDPVLEGGCAWLEGDDGTRYEVDYPGGWRVGFDPVRLMDPAGAVHAVEGDRVTVAGGLEPDAISICQIGPIFRATEVLAP
jgi:hypothetical protein